MEQDCTVSQSTADEIKSFQTTENNEFPEGTHVSEPDGSVANLTIVWNIADCMNALMAIPNLLSLIFLNGVIVHETRKYLWRDRLDREMNE